MSEETESYERVGESFLANFFGILRKHDDFTYCFVCLIPETNSEHQFLGINENVWQYELDWNLEDTSYLAGPSLAYSFSDSISWGVGLFYHYRSGRFNNTEHTNYDFDSDGIREVYWKTSDGTAYLRALMHADGNIRYANYQSESQMSEYLTNNGLSDSISEIIS